DRMRACDREGHALAPGPGAAPPPLRTPRRRASRRGALDETCAGPPLRALRDAPRARPVAARVGTNAPLRRDGLRAAKGGRRAHRPGREPPRRPRPGDGLGLMNAAMPTIRFLGTSLAVDSIDVPKGTRILD